MLSLFDSDHRAGRREFLRIGALGLGGYALPGQLAARDTIVGAKNPLRDKTVVFVLMHGGPSQIETFDPKMSAPQEVRSITGEISTALPGITFGATFPQLAKLADRLAIVRSYVPSPGDANHGIRPVVSKETFEGNLGSAYASVAGSNHALTGMPTNLMLYPRSVDPECRAGTFGSDRLVAPGIFGAATAPLVAGAGGAFQENMQLKMPLARFEDRRELLSALDAARFNLDVAQRDSVDSSRAKAFDVLLRNVADAFDLSKEDPRVVARYDTSPLGRPEQINSKLYHFPDFVGHFKTMGKLMLLARRLCERGAGFITLTTNFVWDMHACGEKNLSLQDGMNHVGRPFDHAISAFLEDVEARGLSDKILLVCCGEMGRTPRITNRGGRDHWANLGALMLAGGGLKMGQVIGQSSRNGGEPNGDPVEIKNLISTVMHTLFDVGQLRLATGVSRAVMEMCSAEPIRGLHG